MGKGDRQFDAIVVGAGPAGSVAALTLARSQHRVLLIDRSTFPRDKICGDGLPPIVIKKLQQMGIHIGDLGTRDVDYKMIEGLEIGAPSRKRLSIEWLPHVQTTVTCPRQRFDNVLFERAVKHGSQFMQAQVTAPLIKNNRLVGVQTREHGEFRAAVVIAADGYGSAVARHAGFHLSKGQSVVSATRAYVRLKQPVRPYFHMHFLSSLRPGYAWLFPIGDGLANVGLGLAGSQLNSTQLREALAEYLQDWWHGQVELLDGTPHQWPIPLWNQDTQSRFKNGVFITGDAGAFVDPLTGGGISAAVLTGLWAAQSVEQYLNGAWSLTAAGANYEALWRKKLQPLLDNMFRVKVQVVDRPLVFNLLFNMAYYLPFLRHRILHTFAGEHT